MLENSISKNNMRSAREPNQKPGDGRARYPNVRLWPSAAIFIGKMEPPVAHGDTSPELRCDVIMNIADIN